ncbi:hypothetical protein BDP27DRAFT_1357195 [Rhodocollybia butyracea]|uniref:Nephrocystin 3-like N-terminal domain-containing protein n=1 Tax=Rhodocollybia butyracea TaxID=206335 RepID=A0A9P5QBZ6_9AGAR|nr:hypothetical protein BDP27DRAFT_1357195 [Rhodocollybia butyracea]
MPIYPPANLRPTQTFRETDGFASQHTEDSERSDRYLPPNYNRSTTNINDCTFVSHARQGEKGIDKLHSVAVLEALHDSADSFPNQDAIPKRAQKCSKICRSGRWIKTPAATFCGCLDRQGPEKCWPAWGCFFFKRAHTKRGNEKALFVTIAYQLAISVPWLKGPISQVVEDDPSVVARSIEIQLQKLISEPCRMHPNQTPLTILIDGLDECEEHFLPLRFIIASRPEAHIREMFESSVYHGVYRIFNVEQSFDDVRTYFLDEFARIHREHQRLAIVMKDQVGPDSAFDALDQLYIDILSTVPITKRHKLTPILCALANFDFYPNSLDRLLGMEIGDTHLSLRSLHSIIYVPSESEVDEAEDLESVVISGHHASFYEFLDDPKRSQNFYVGGLHHRMDLARSTLRFFACEQEYDDISMVLPTRYLFFH